MESLLVRTIAQIREVTQWPEGLIYVDVTALGADKLKKIGLSGRFFGWGAFEDQEAEGIRAFEKVRKDPDALIVREGELCMAPLRMESGTAFGVLLMRTSGEPPQEMLQLFSVYAKQVGAVMGNRIYQELLKVQNDELNQAYMETIDLIRKMVDAKDDYTRGHSDRVSFYGVNIARALGRTEEYVERVRIGGLFHDIGKIGVPDAILRKPSRLTDEEYCVIKRHPERGKQLLASLSSFRDILPMVEYHHEWYNGNGYPKGLSGNDIPEMARIISVADAFDAMTSKRTYRDSLSVDQAVSELKKGKNTQFDSMIVDAFIGVIHSSDLFSHAKDLFPEQGTNIQEV